MNQENELSFSSVLQLLFGEEQVPIHLLYRLSDLTAEELAQFDARWSEVPDQRRFVIMQHLADIVEDNFVVDFVPMFARGMRDASSPVRVAALDGLWDSTDTSLIPSIIDLLQRDESVDVQAAAAAALAHYVLMVEWGQLPKAVSPPIVEALLAIYDAPDSAVSVRRAALEAVSSAHHPRVPSLIEDAYESEDLDIQLSAVFAMGRSADPRWLSVIQGEMLSQYAQMRAEAARAAGAISSEAAVPDLANLTVDEDIDVALAAVSALGEIGGELASRVLIQLADDPDLEPLHEAVEEALDEIEWLGGMSDMLSLSDADEFEVD